MLELDIDDDALFALQEQQINDQVIKARQALDKPKTKGCLFCHDPLPPTRSSFCDTGCQAFHEKEQHNKRVRGLA